MGRFTMAAKTHMTIAELYEGEFPDKQHCMEHYQKAADYYKGEEAKSSASKCIIKVAMVSELGLLGLKIHSPLKPHICSWPPSWGNTARQWTSSRRLPSTKQTTPP